MKLTKIPKPPKPSKWKNCFSYFSVSVKRHDDQGDWYKCEFIGSLQFQSVEVNDHHSKEHDCRQAGSHVNKAVAESLYLIYKKAEIAVANWTLPGHLKP